MYILQQLFWEEKYKERANGEEERGGEGKKQICKEKKPFWMIILALQQQYSIILSARALQAWLRVRILCLDLREFSFRCCYCKLCAVYCINRLAWNKWRRRRVESPGSNGDENGELLCDGDGKTGRRKKGKGVSIGETWPNLA